MTHDELIATLKYCLAVIRSRLVDDRYQYQRWFWELREKVALYALRSQFHDLRDLDVAPLSIDQRREVLKTHPLLAPHQPTPVTPSSSEQRTLQNAIRRKLAKSYLAAPPPSPPSA